MFLHISCLLFLMVVGRARRLGLRLPAFIILKESYKLREDKRSRRTVNDSGRVPLCCKKLKERSGSIKHRWKKKTRRSTPNTSRNLKDLRSNLEKSIPCKWLVTEASAKLTNTLIGNYWHHRHDLFSKYDQGIRMDEEGWYSVTPEEIAIGHAERSHGGAIIDGFAGVGGNSIQFALRCFHVVSIDINPQKVDMALHNARIYGVENFIDFVIGDFFQLAPFLKTFWQGDVAFLSPPWGGPKYKEHDVYTLDMLKPVGGYSLFQAAQMITSNIIMFLPRNVDKNQVEELCWLSSPPLMCEIEENYIRGFLKGVTAYFGTALDGKSSRISLN